MDPMNSGHFVYDAQPQMGSTAARFSAHYAAQQIEQHGDPSYHLGNMIQSLGGNPQRAQELEPGLLSLYIITLIVARRGTP